MAELQKEKLWTKDYIVAAISGLFASMVFYITVTTFAMYAVATYQVNESIAGLVAGVFVVGSACGRLFSGRYTEQIGRRKVILIGGVLFFVIGLAYLIPMPIVAFLVFRWLHGVSFGMYHNALLTVATGLIPVSRRGEGLSYFSLNFVLATALGPFVGLYFIHHFSYPALFVACSVLALLALVLGALVKIKPPVFTEEQLLHLKAKSTITDFFEKKALPIAVIIFIMSICYASVTAFVDAYTIQMNLANFASAFFIIYAIVILIVRPFGGKLLDRKGDNIVMLPSIAFFAVSLLLLGFADNKVLLLVVSVCMALGYGNILTAGQAIAVNSSPHHRISTATSTYFIFNDLGQGVGPLIMGMIAARQNFSAMYFVAAVIIALSLALYYVLHGRQARKGH
ncbi:MFS transporter [Clostridia bacterium]|nr:MFS transporter [Clostridia bacterium]